MSSGVKHWDSDGFLGNIIGSQVSVLAEEEWDMNVIYYDAENQIAAG